MTDPVQPDPACEPVTYEVVNGVAWLTIDRPEARNALNKAVRDGLFDGVRRFNADDARQGAGAHRRRRPAFCAGGDLKEMAEAALQVPPPDFLPQFGRNISVDKPTIAAVNGVAFAGGFLLAQNCDLVIAAATRARFARHRGQGRPRLAVGRPAVLADPGPRVAMEILLTGDPLTAERAHEVGLVNQVVPDGELRAAAQSLAERIAANAPLSVRAAKQTVYLSAQMGWPRPSTRPSASGSRSTPATTPRRGRPRSARSGPPCGRGTDGAGPGRRMPAARWSTRWSTTSSRSPPRCAQVLAGLPAADWARPTPAAGLDRHRPGHPPGLLRRRHRGCR